MTSRSPFSYAKFIGYLALAGIVVIIDQVSKQAAYANLMGQSPIEVLPFFKLVLVFNEGAAFGFLNDAGGWQYYFFTGLAIIVSAMLVLWLWHEHNRNTVLCWGLALVLGGALGNLFDRIGDQLVTDFILLHFRGRQFPVFNTADIAITLGAIALILDSLGWRRNQRDS